MVLFLCKAERRAVFGRQRTRAIPDTLPTLFIPTGAEPLKVERREVVNNSAAACSDGSELRLSNRSPCEGCVKNIGSPHRLHARFRWPAPAGCCLAPQPRPVTVVQLAPFRGPS